VAAGIRMTLNRRVRAPPDPVLAVGPIVLGMDDFALRGHITNARPSAHRSLIQTGSPTWTYEDTTVSAESSTSTNM
jgi:hypothetical protein